MNLPQDSGFDSTEGAYDIKEIHRVVNLLPNEYRIPFAMHVSGFKYREIAEKIIFAAWNSKKVVSFLLVNACRDSYVILCN